MNENPSCLRLSCTSLVEPRFLLVSSVFVLVVLLCTCYSDDHKDKEGNHRKDRSPILWKMSLNNLNKVSGGGESCGTFASNFFDAPLTAALSKSRGSLDSSQQHNSEMLSELEKMAAQELRQKIDEGKRTWKYQSQLTLLWQRYMEDTEQVIRRKVEQIRNTVRNMDKGQLLERRFSASAATTGCSTASKVNYYSGGIGGREDKVGILLEESKGEFAEGWPNIRGYRNEERKDKRNERVSAGVKINILDEEGNEKEEMFGDNDSDDMERMIK